MRVGITGTRKGLTSKQFIAFHNQIKHNEVSEIHHGDACGCDQQINYETRHLFPDIKIVKHLPEHFTSKYLLKRNREIVDICDILWAFPKSRKEELRSGTWATIRYARKKKMPIIIIYPDGGLNGRMY